MLSYSVIIVRRKTTRKIEWFHRIFWRFSLFNRIFRSNQSKAIIIVLSWTHNHVFSLLRMMTVCTTKKTINGHSSCVWNSWIAFENNTVEVIFRYDEEINLTIIDHGAYSRLFLHDSAINFTPDSDGNFF